MRKYMFALLLAVLSVSPRVMAQEYDDGEESYEIPSDSVVLSMKAEELTNGYLFSDSLWQLIEFIPEDTLDDDIRTVKFYPNRDRRTAIAYFTLKNGGQLVVEGYNLEAFFAERRKELLDPNRHYDYGRSRPEFVADGKFPRKGVRYADMYEHGDPMIFNEKGPSSQGNEDTQMWFSIMIPAQVAKRVEKQYDALYNKASGEPTKEMLDEFTTSISYLGYVVL